MMPVSVRIEGRGPVAAALCLFLLREGFLPSEIIAEAPSPELPDWLGARAIALSLGSLELLAPHVPDLAPEHLRGATGFAAPIESVAVLRAGAFGRTLIEPPSKGRGCLGAVLRYESLHHRLREALKRCAAHLPELTAQSTHQESTDRRSPQVHVIADGEPRDGARRDFGQHALISEVRVGRGDPGRAWERFTNEGPLAILPLPDASGNRRALVWCASSAETLRRCDLPADKFDRELLQAFGPVLGPIRVDGPRFATALKREYRPHRIDTLKVAIGNAAQSLHPVAGQGLNLGLRDAWVLARCLGDWRALRGPRHATGDLDDQREQQAGLIQALDRFCALRQGDQHALVTITDVLATWPRTPLLKPAQSIALASIDLCRPLKSSARHHFTHGFRRL